LLAFSASIIAYFTHYINGLNVIQETLLKHFVLWVNVPIEDVNHRKVSEYTDYLIWKGLRPKTINCHLACIRAFYAYLYYEEDIKIPNPVRKGPALKVPKPLPKHLRDEQVHVFFDGITKKRDRAIFKVMLRCGLRVEETANLTLADLDFRRRRIFVQNGKGGKGRVVYISEDAQDALLEYLRQRGPSRTKKLFLVEKGPYKGKPISVRGIQKRMEYYCRITGIKISCHQLRHTMATQLLNADTDAESIRDLLGHNMIETTQRYLTVSNQKVKRDFFRAMEVILQRSPP